MEGGELDGVDDARVNVDVVDDDIEHFGGLGILGDLGAQGGLVVGGTDGLVAFRGHGLQHGAHLVQSALLLLHGGQDGEDGELIVEQGAVLGLHLVELGHGHHAELLLHAADGIILQLQDTDGGHGRAN